MLQCLTQVFHFALIAFAFAKFSLKVLPAKVVNFDLNFPYSQLNPNFPSPTIFATPFISTVLLRVFISNLNILFQVLSAHLACLIQITCTFGSFQNFTSQFHT